MSGTGLVRSRKAGQLGLLLVGIHQPVIMALRRILLCLTLFCSLLLSGQPWMTQAHASASQVAVKRNGPAEVVNPAYNLTIQLSPAACSLMSGNQRQCRDDYWLSVQDFRLEYPAGVSAPVCRPVSALLLSPIQENLVSRIIPDRAVRQRIWQQSGGCTARSPTDFFRLISSNVDMLKLPGVFRAQRDVVVQERTLRQQFRQANRGMQDDGFYYACEFSPQRKRKILTSVHVCFDVAGRLSRCPGFASRPLTCDSSIYIQGIGRNRNR